MALTICVAPSNHTPLASFKYIQSAWSEQYHEMYGLSSTMKCMGECLLLQVGCAMNCQFCYTGRMGLSANLSTAQIVEQVSLLAWWWSCRLYSQS
jgi:hypothetical protein